MLNSMSSVVVFPMEVTDIGSVKFVTSSVLNETSTIELVGVQWKLMTNPNMFHRGDLYINLECNNENEISNLWKFDAEIELLVTNNRGLKFAKNIFHRFDDISDKIGLGKVTACEFLLPIAMIDVEILKGLEMQFDVNIRINSIVGIQNYELPSFSIPKNDDSEVVLSVEGQKLYIDKYVLFHASSVFREMLSDDDEIEIKDVEVEHFVTFLHFLYGKKPRITKDNAEHLLKLAEQFDVPFLMTELEDFLSSLESSNV